MGVVTTLSTVRGMFLIAASRAAQQVAALETASNDPDDDAEMLYSWFYFVFPSSQVKNTPAWSSVRRL